MTIARGRMDSAFSTWRALAALALILGAVFLFRFAVAQAPNDNDSDGMDDAWEAIFGLDDQNPADAALNGDSDAWLNVQEATAGTDPTRPDTDLDGWADPADAAPLSRAVVYWGLRPFLLDDGYWYPGPAWWTNAWKEAGVWLDPTPEPGDPPHGLKVLASKQEGQGKLHLDLNRTLLPTNNLALRVDLLDTADAQLYADLLDAAGQPVLTNFAGNLLCGSGTNVSLRVNCPLASYPSAASIRLRRGTGYILVYTSVLYIDEDGDELDAAQEAQLGTSDYAADSDGDGLSDGEELSLGTDPAVADSDGDGLHDGLELNTWHTDPWNTDTDGDGLSDGDEVNISHTDPLNPDTDGDLLTDSDEVLRTHTNPLLPDTDLDGLTDKQEDSLGTDPTNADTDGDGMPDGWEFANDLDPKDLSDASADADRDGVSNLNEYLLGRSPHVAESTPGAVLYERWSDFAGRSVADLLACARYPASPDLLQLLPGIDAPRDQADDYGARMRCWIEPSVSGLYVLRISSDDNSELWLGEDDRAASRRRIACVADWCPYGDFTREPGQTSAPLVLEGGHRYYLEVLFKEGSGGDHAEVQWSAPGSTDFCAIPSAHLASYVHPSDDLDDDGMPDPWETDQGFDTSEPRDAFEDPDYDGQPNYHEYYLGRSPRVAESTSGKLFYERWNDIDGMRVVDLQTAPKFLGRADAWSLTDTADFPRNVGDNYGARLRGWLTAPATGDYEFWIASDDEGQLWLSTDDTPWNRRCLAKDLLSNPEDWDDEAMQYSGPIHLEAGQRCYLEVLFKEGPVSDYCSVAWRRPDTGVREFIPASALASYIPCAGDTDGDGLTDAEEAVLGTDPACVDTDGDLLPDGDEARFYHTNPLVADTDNDGLADGREALSLGTNPNSTDTDGDGMPDAWEVAQGLNPTDPSDAIADPDRDGVSNLNEYLLGRSPLVAESTPGAVLYERWSNLGGRGVGELLACDRYPASPDIVQLLPGIDAPRDQADDYGARLRCWIEPSVSGLYVLRISSDDNSELWLGENDRAASRRCIARVTDWCPYGDFTREPGQTSAPLALEGGHRYYLEVLFKEGWGGDHVEVQWSTPDAPDFAAPPSANLVSYAHPADDRDDDGMPDDWETANGFNPDHPRDALEDPDGDGLPNWREYYLGYSPGVPPESTPGTLLYERWAGIPGDMVSDFTQSARFYDPADVWMLLDQASAPSDVADYYGARLRGYLCAPVSGIYHFWVASDNDSELWLGAAESPASRRLIAWFTGWTDPGNFGAQTSQASAPIVLEGGGIYYFELRFKEGWGGDHAEAAWLRPDRTEAEVVPGVHFISYARSAEDSDGDGMDDAWEVAQGLDPTDEGDLLGDGDLDGLCNGDEFLAGRLPQVAESTPGAVLYERWQNLGGTRVRDLIRSQEFAAPPAAVHLLSGLDAPRDVTDFYGARMRCWIEPPVSGEYVFGFSSDDHGELWLGTDDRAASRRLIARVADWCPHGDFTKEQGQISLPVTLEVGCRYYLEAVFKEHDGLDQAEVVWLVPGAAESAALPSANLSSYARPADDLDDDAVPDAWETAHGLDPADRRDAFADPDHDGVATYREYLLDRSPSVPETTPGALRYERWHGIDGMRVSELRLAANFLGPADETDFLASADFPRNVGDNYGARVRGWLTAPATGDYEFWIASDDEGQLWLSTDDTPWNRRCLAKDDLSAVEDWDHETGQYSGPVRLEAGQRYYFEVLYKEGPGYDYCSVAWRRPDTGIREIIPSTAFESYTAPVGDTDGDGLTDAEEAVLGADPTLVDTDGDLLTDGDEACFYQTDPLVADTDQDGLDDGQEILRYGTDPLAVDTDGDGLCDGAEVLQYASDPLKADTDGDFLSDGDEVGRGLNLLSMDTDQDGLNDGDEINVWFSDPLASDTDGDGFSDGMEVHTLLSSPTVVEFDGVQTLVTGIPASSGTNDIGRWEAMGSYLRCVSGRGAAMFPLALPRDGLFALEVDVSLQRASTDPATVHLVLTCDGIPCGSFLTPLPSTAPGTAFFILPPLTAGAHTLRLEWRNYLVDNALLEVRQLRVMELGGPDLDGNGRPDWQDARACALLVACDIASSPVSPVCIEGASARPEGVRIFNGADEQPVRPAIGNNWYADVSLSATSSTAVAIYADGGWVSRSLNIEWISWNLFEAPTNALQIRRGDALRLLARPAAASGGVMEIDVPGVTNLFSETLEPLPVAFESAGAYEVVGRYVQGEETLVATATVHVVEASFGGDAYCRVAVARTWSCAALPPEAAIEQDPAIELVSTPRAGGGLDFHLIAPDAGPYGVLARLGEEGPVLDAVRIHGVEMDSTAFRRLQVVQQFDDGSSLVQIRLRLNEVPPDLRLDIAMYVGGVRFDDGTITRTVTAADFDANGEYVYYLIRDANITVSVCHYGTLYSGGVVIGTMK